MKAIYSILIALAIFSPKISLANEDPCAAYLEEIKKHNFITYTMNESTIDYVLRYRNGLFKEFSGSCKSYHPGKDSIELTQYFDNVDMALFKVIKGYMKSPTNISYLLIDIKNGDEQIVNSMTPPIVSPDKKRIVTDFTKELAIFYIGNGKIEIEYQTPQKNNQLKFGDMVYSISSLNYMDSNNQAANKESEGWISNEEIKFQHFEIGIDTAENYKEQFLILTSDGWTVKQ